MEINIPGRKMCIHLPIGMMYKIFNIIHRVDQLKVMAHQLKLALINEDRHQLKQDVGA